ncbi:hypothetical protein BGX26_010027 [Mortierella sp. AD094]|nr:hypothetical protein BGX26_010027 [Mortierella sp. AD094]
MHVRDNVIDAMTSIINDTRNIVNAERGRVYTPRTSPYETDCRQLNTLFLNGLNDRMLLPNDGCMYLFFILTAPPTVAQEITTAKVLKRAPGRWRFIGARTPDDTFQQMYVVPGMSNGNVSCYSDRIGTRAPISLVDGVIYPPRTTTTECLNPNGEVWVLSSTWVMFSTTTAKQFRTVTSAIFEEYDELLQAMEASINSPNFPSTPVAIAELKVVNTTVDSLICISGNSTTIVGSTALSCVYSSTYAIMTKPLNTSLLISNARGGQAPGKHQLYLDAYLPNIAMTIDHIPNVLNRTRSPFSFAVMKNASSAASTYLASLGPNIYMDWDTHKLYTLFDTLDTVEGFEIPTWLFVFLITTIVLCLAFWGAAKYKLDEGYMSSLHKNIAVGIGARMGWDSPILLRFNANPMSFEGCAVVPEDRDFHK